MMLRFKCFLSFLLLSGMVCSQIVVKDKMSGRKQCFSVVSDGTVATVVYDTLDYKVVAKSVGLFADDIRKVTGRKPVVTCSLPEADNEVIVIGTVGCSRIVDELVQRGKIDVSDIRGQWERFLIQTVEKPFRGIGKALVIAGSDKRGTAYGVFSVSEAIGVSPWHYWADVPADKHEELYIDNLVYTSESPSVKYRGIFINDEDWGLHPWAAGKTDPEVGGIGPNAYEKVFELLLRLKANMMAPAMHECTKAFYTVPGNMEMADTYGIMITTSHCEPLLYNNASEWDNRTQGEWNYKSNKQAIDKVLDERVGQAADKENIYTIALRGKHDQGMKGDSMEEKFELLEQAIKSQREILARHMNKPLHEIPQIFVPYKEVLDLYEKGLQVPEDITLVWPDDNYGYLKKLSNPEEQKRSGGAGVYYHISYLGWPNDYLWLNTTSPALIYAELQKAWLLGARKYWLLNAGDIKPGELGIQLFLDMAWDFGKFSFENVCSHNADFLTSIFGDEYTQDIARVLDSYYHLAFLRKPEYMTWDWRWNSLFAKTAIKDTEFSFINYNEAENRMAEYGRITGMVEKIMTGLPEELKPAFFELLYYPVKASCFYNMEMLLAQKNRWYASQSRAATSQLADLAQSYHDSLEIITTAYQQLLDGKWNGIITAPGFVPEKQYPPVKRIDVPPAAGMEVFVENCEPGQDTLVLPCFYEDADQSHYFEIYNKGSESFGWKATADKEWIRLDIEHGTVDKQQRVIVSIDWKKISSALLQTGEILIEGNDCSRKITVAAMAANDALHDLYAVENGVVSISPARYQRKVENGGIGFTEIGGLGYCNAALQLGSPSMDDGCGSCVEYDFYLENPLLVDTLVMYVYMLPLFPKDKAHGAAYGIRLDDSELVVLDNTPREYSHDWARNVLRNSAINKVKFAAGKPGKHTLKIYSVDPGMIIHKIVIDCGGLKKSYTGPKDTYRK